MCLRFTLKWLEFSHWKKKFASFGLRFRLLVYNWTLFYFEFLNEKNFGLKSQILDPPVHLKTKTGTSSPPRHWSKMHVIKGDQLKMNLRYWPSPRGLITSWKMLSERCFAVESIHQQTLAILARQFENETKKLQWTNFWQPDSNFNSNYWSQLRKPAKLKYIDPLRIDWPKASLLISCLLG